MKVEEAFFIPHCDLDGCDLGSFEYNCPVCNKYIQDYYVWWKQDEIYNGLRHEFECEENKCQLIVFWNKEEYEYQVIKKVNI